MILGLTLFLIGVLIRMIAINQMGNFTFEIKYKDKIKDSGFYKYVRHPAYIGSFIMFIGLVLISLKIAFLYLVFVFYLARVIEEESILINNPEYRDYQKRTGMFFPKLKRGN